MRHMLTMSDYKSVKIISSLTDQADKIVNDKKHGFHSRADYINSLIRQDLRDRLGFAEGVFYCRNCHEEILRKAGVVS